MSKFKQAGSLSCFAMSLDKAVRKLRGCSKSPDDNFVPDKKYSHPMIRKQHFVPVSNEEVEASKKAIMKNTQKSTMWAVRMFMSWVEKRNKRNDEKCPIEVLCSSYMAELCHWLCVFVKRPGMMTSSRIHHVALHNYFLPYSASLIQKGSLRSCW